MIDAALLAHVIAAVEAEGDRLRAEFYRADGPRGSDGDAPIDAEMEARLRERLQALVPATFTGEETGTTPGSLAGFTWLVDPQDGTTDFLKGRRGSAVSVALLRGGEPVLGVVHAPDAPDRGRDTIAWAEGGGPLQRNGRPLAVDLSRRTLEAGEYIWATASSAARPATFARAAAPARCIAMPSIAYRLARVAAGDGVAAITVHPISEYDIAAGMALMRGARGIALDAAGHEIVFNAAAVSHHSACFAGAPDAVRRLARFDWHALEEEDRREARLALRFPLRFPRRDDPLRLARAQGCLLGQVIGDGFDSLPGIGGAAEPALVLARSLVRERAHDPAKLLEAYRAWLASDPESGAQESQGSFARISPAGIFAAGDPARAAVMARADAALTQGADAGAGFAAAIAQGVAGGTREAMLEAALAHAQGPAREAILRGAHGEPPADFGSRQSLVALQNAFFRLMHAPSLEEGLVATVSAGGDTTTNAAITGSLLGAAYGREGIPARWIHAVLACRSLADRRVRPAEYWPDDVLELAEALLAGGSAGG